MLTRLGLAGFGKSYGVIAAKAAAPVVTAAARLTRLGLGGPAANYGIFAAKAAAGGDGSVATIDFITMARRRGRR